MVPTFDIRQCMLSMLVTSRAIYFKAHGVRMLEESAGRFFNLINYAEILKSEPWLTVVQKRLGKNIAGVSPGTPFAASCLLDVHKPSQLIKTSA